MSVKMFPTPRLHTGAKRFVQFQVTRQDQLTPEAKEANALAGTVQAEKKPRKRSKANRLKNPTRAEKKATRERNAMLRKRFSKATT